MMSKKGLWTSKAFGQMAVSHWQFSGKRNKKVNAQEKDPRIQGEFRIDHVAVSVSNLSRSVKFYESNFGFTCERVVELPGKRGQVALLSKAGFAIEMFELFGALPLPDYRKTPETDLNTIGVKHFALKVTDVLAAAKLLKSRGVELTSEPAVGIRGVSRFFVKDPDGVGIEITESSPI
jgi:methylmalonyl-CoA/ethylmalonyl-CoA epimerase